MPHTLVFLADAFDSQVNHALEFVDHLEGNRTAYPEGDAALTVMILELSHELAFLRLFGFWEGFLEQVFVRLLCGYSRPNGAVEPMLAGQSYSSTISGATLKMLGTQNYVAWYVPSDIVGRSRRFFDGGNFELVVASASQILSDQSVTRHQIAHVQAHARSKFDAMTMRLVGKRFRGSRPGRFLRADRPGTTEPWLNHFAAQLRGLANQLAR